MSTPNNPPESPERSAELDFAFLHRVYRTSLMLMLFGGLLLWSQFGAPAALGWNLGAGMSLLLLVSLEWTVRRFLNPQQRSMGRVAGSFLLKIPLVVLVLVLAYVAARRGWLSLIWMLAGFAVPHLVLVLKLAGRKFNELIGAGQAERPSGRHSRH